MKNKPTVRRNLGKDVETKPVPPIMPRPRQQADNKTALQFLDSIIALSPVNRQTHVQGQQAIGQISQALKRLETFIFAEENDLKIKKDKGKTDGENKT